MPWRTATRASSSRLRSRALPRQSTASWRARGRSASSSWSGPASRPAGGGRSGRSPRPVDDVSLVLMARRPDPDALLQQVRAEEARAQRGHLKIFFGASPGVGKTFAMLEAARLKRAAGQDIVIGVVETHGREDPRRRLDYRGTVLEEFDIDAALARRPGLLLVDELAHTNAPGARHAKRWQDVEELLAAGIDVYTTVNVQHLESLNDVVAQI